ncbi:MULTISPECIES: DNA-binding protein [unclassified Cytobacillus]|uniref:DNA-binding protein n=1 Tax=unclassified Cytobacillus TaxID=2675268 RepID=UPI001915AC8B|nr:DNA-binding protein [Cytobacillus sp. AMY 15.2]MCM3089956.1 DNA-binding protein [Cytobacillus sp. AMY 15.2]
MSNTNLRKENLIYCSVVTELQAAQVTKICQDYGIQSVIKLKPYVDISQLKKALKTKMKDKLYDPCPCGKGKKFKFCCYKDELEIKLL